MSLEANLASLSNWFTSTFNLSDPTFGQAIVSIGYYLAIAIEKTTGKIIDVPIK